MVKAVIIGDPHFRIDNIQEVDMFIERISALVSEEKPDFVVCLGDLLHTHERLHTIALNKAYEFVQKLSSICKIFILVGNHDYIQNQQFLTKNHWMNGMKTWENVCIVDEVLPVDFDGCKFIFLPYVPNGRFMEAMSTIEEPLWKSASCIFAHQEFYGCKMGAIISVDGDKWEESYPEIISGHIHSKQRPQKNIYYPGAAIQTAFGESEENIIAVVQFNNRKKGYELSERDLGLPRKRIIYTDMEAIENMVVDDVDKNVKLTVSGTDYNEFKAFKKTEAYKSLIENGAKIAFKVKQVDAKNVEESKKEVKDTDFKTILHDLVVQDKSLLELYELVVNKTEVILI